MTFLSTMHPESVPTSLILFDSALDSLSLPVVKTQPSSRRIDFGAELETDVITGGRREYVLRFVEKYFECIGSVVDEGSGKGR
jgi:hypothetical protein